MRAIHVSPACSIRPTLTTRKATRSVVTGWRLTLQLDAEGRIVAVAWDAEGCAISQASASMLAEHILEMPLAEARSLTREEMLDMIGIPLAMNRVKCALLPLKALYIGSEGVA